MELEGTYDPLDVESGWYEHWEEEGYFEADADSDHEPFTIVIPPPNVTGSLHMGHALFVTLQDIMTRWKRMEGYEALWLPGTDHAGIATQVMVERQLAEEEGKTRHDLGREEFLERVWEWKDEQGGQILEQLKRMGASCDWSRERFTLDDGLNEAVKEAFVQLYEDDLLYRDERMVDWDPESQTVLSDLEVNNEEEMGTFWYMRYPLVDHDRHVVVGTTRPETMLGDTAVAVHPDDKRYQEIVGEVVELPLVGRHIPIIADTELPDPEEGTGAVKVTPAHDPDDFACGKRHDLEVIQVIDFDVQINDNAPERYRGMDRYEAREQIVEDLEAQDYLEKTEEREYAPGRSDRTDAVVEPLPLEQWFVDTEPLADRAIDTVESGETEIIPEVWKKTYDHFMYNIEPWCISRQLWWGHRIPAWYCDDCDGITVAREEPDACEECGSEAIEQDPDVLDTWFSSALWPFSTLGWPDQTPDLEKFYPTQVMETGFDILFFWVARMLMMGLHFMDESPFEQVYLHAMVRDIEGRKMSKTYGNVIDPLHMIHGVDHDELDPDLHRELMNQYPEGVEPQGADALRFTLAIYAAQGRDIKLDISRIEGYRAFLNKLWNAARFVMMNLEDYTPLDYESRTGDWDGEMPFDREALSPADRWILSRLDETIDEVQAGLEDFRFDDVAQTLYDFIWHEFCDWYIELSKTTLYDDEASESAKQTTRQVLIHVLESVLRLLHPITPYVTEEIWQEVPTSDEAPDSIMVAPWPEQREAIDFGDTVDHMELVLGLIRSIRGIRGETDVDPGADIEEVHFVTDEADHREAIRAGATYIREMATVESIEVESPDEADEIEGTATAVHEGVDIRIPLRGMIDIEEELERLHKELDRVAEDIGYVRGQLDNEAFVENAPEEVVQQERDKLESYLEERERLQASVEELEQLREPET